MDTESVLKAISYVEHPSINATLMKLGILSKVEAIDKEIIAEFAFPFPNIPIKESLIVSVQIVSESLGFKFKYTDRVMNSEEKEHFLKIEHANWKDGSQAMCS
jgi:hypothetical protein